MGEDERICACPRCGRDCERVGEIEGTDVFQCAACTTEPAPGLTAAYTFAVLPSGELIDSDWLI